MKKLLTVILSLVTVISIFTGTAFTLTPTESGAVSYYDENGNPITIDGLYYNAQGVPCFNAECYYLDGDGTPVFVGGCQAYCYDVNGDFIPCRYYYNATGEAVNPPASYRGGCGFGTWCYGDNGAVVNGSFYYDDFGNPVTPPAQGKPGNGRGGGCCGGGRSGKRR